MCRICVIAMMACAIVVVMTISPVSARDSLRENDSLGGVVISGSASIHREMNLSSILDRRAALDGLANLQLENRQLNVDIKDIQPQVLDLKAVLGKSTLSESDLQANLRIRCLSNGDSAKDLLALSLEKLARIHKEILSDYLSEGLVNLKEGALELL